jgi:hypothetical protein
LIQEVFLESRILDSMYFGTGEMGTRMQKKMRCLITKKCPKALSFRVQNV